MGRSAIAPALSILLLMGCSSNGGLPDVVGKTIDGWSVGSAVANCSSAQLDGYDGVRGETVHGCSGLVSAAQAELDHRDGGQPAVVASGLYEPGSGVSTRTFPIKVAVFSLADGTTRAIGVGVSVGGIILADFGP